MCSALNPACRAHRQPHPCSAQPRPALSVLLQAEWYRDLLGFPNNYCITKRMAECLMYERAKQVWKGGPQARFDGAGYVCAGCWLCVGGVERVQRWSLG